MNNTDNNNNTKKRIWPSKRYRSRLEICKDVLELFLIKEEMQISDIRLITNWIRSAELYHLLLSNGFIEKNRNDLPRVKRKAYSTFSLTNKGKNLLNKIKELDNLLPFQQLNNVESYPYGKLMRKRKNNKNE